MGSKKQTKSERLSEEFDLIQEHGEDFDISSHLATLDDLPELGDIALYDYDADLQTVSLKGIDLMESLVDLYLSDFPELQRHDYIQNKLNEDAMVYAESLFLQKMTRKNFLVQLRQVDNGDNSARMHEVVNQTIKEIRENSKFASKQRSEIEKSYRDFRKDLTEVVSSMKGGGVPEDDGDGQIIDPTKLNDLINATLSKKKDDHRDDDDD
jgi:hypothetical protein